MPSSCFSSSDDSGAGAFQLYVKLLSSFVSRLTWPRPAPGEPWARAIPPTALPATALSFLFFPSWCSTSSKKRSRLALSFFFSPALVSLLLLQLGVSVRSFLRAASACFWTQCRLAA